MIIIRITILLLIAACTPTLQSAQQSHTISPAHKKFSSVQHDDQDADGNTPLLRDAFAGNTSRVTLLLGCLSEEQIHHRNKLGLSARALAWAAGHVEIAAQLAHVLPYTETERNFFTTLHEPLKTLPQQIL